jgi:HEPN domain-containing protein
MKRLDDRDVAPWISIARADLAMADLALGNTASTPDMLGLSCFHSQQAAEKALKGVLVALDDIPPRTHDLTLLAERKQVRGRIDEDVLRAMTRVSEYGVGPRYPGLYSACSRDEALAARADAERVWQWALAQFANPSR